MARFEVAVLNDALIKRPTRDLMWTAQYTAGDKGYGMGWGMIKKGNTVTYSHSGGQQGTSTFIAVMPAQKLGVVVLINMEEAGADDLGKDLLKILQDREK